MTAKTSEAAAARVVSAQQTARDAQAAFERTVRDEVDAKRLNPSDVARALGIKNRQRVYAILGRGKDGSMHVAPAPQPVVYLRGRGQPQDIWERVETAMWARGWRTVRDRTTAWHLARGGTPVVLVDFTSELDGLAVDWITVGRVRARYEVTTRPVALAELLLTNDRARLLRDRALWLDQVVSVADQEMDLPLVNGGRLDRPRGADGCLDESAVARMVAAALV